MTRVDLDMGQDLDLSAGKLGESCVRGAAEWGPVKGMLLTRFLAFGAAPAAGSWGSLDPGVPRPLHRDPLRPRRQPTPAATGSPSASWPLLGSPRRPSRRGSTRSSTRAPIPFQTFGQGTAGLEGARGRGARRAVGHALLGADRLRHALRRRSGGAGRDRPCSRTPSRPPGTPRATAGAAWCGSRSRSAGTTGSRPGSTSRPSPG